MIEILIGREEDQNRLRATVNGKEAIIGTPNCVPGTVSREHCRIYFDENENISIENAKPTNCTFVDGKPILKKRITENSRVTLSPSHYALDMSNLIEELRKRGLLPPKLYSLFPLQFVWDNYHDTKLKMQLDEKKKANQGRLQGLLSMGGMLFMVIPFEKLFGEEFGAIAWCIRVVTLVLSLGMGAYFYFRGMNQANDILVKMDKLDKDFQSKYICPNPTCPRFMGNQPYNLLQHTPACPLCKCRYTNKKR